MKATNEIGEVTKKVQSVIGIKYQVVEELKQLSANNS